MSVFHHGKKLPLGYLRFHAASWVVQDIQERDGEGGYEPNKFTKDAELVKFCEGCEKLQRHLIRLDEWVTWCQIKFSAVQTKCCTLKGRKKWMCSYSSQGSQLPAGAWERQLSFTVDGSMIIWMQSTALIYWSGKVLDCTRNRTENNV